MAELLTITGTPGAGAAPLAGQAPRHCGTPMRWTAPVLDAMAVYSFDTGSGSAELPPVWRCTCGFQLDGVVHTPNSLAALS